jgi:Cu+-exporting ATPase
VEICHKRQLRLQPHRIHRRSHSRLPPRNGHRQPCCHTRRCCKGAQNGILIKGGDYLEKTRELQAVIFDKTGTLTKGKLAVTDIIGDNQESLLTLAASLENMSEHPVGQAIVGEAKRRSIVLEKPEDFEVFPGKGVKGKVRGKMAVIGTQRFIEESNITMSKAFQTSAEVEDIVQGLSVYSGLNAKQLSDIVDWLRGSVLTATVCRLAT